MEDINANTENKDKVVVVMVPLPAQGHLNQLLHLAQFITSYGIPVHYAGSSSHNHQAKLRFQGWDDQTLTTITFHDFQLPSHESPLPIVDLSNPFPKHLQPLFEAATLLRQPVYQLLLQLSIKFKRVIVIHDLNMPSVVQDVKLIPNAEAYNFMPTSAFTLFVNFWESLPEEWKPFELDSEIVPENMPSQDKTMTPEMLDFANKQYECLGFESGWIYNTSTVIEGKYVELMDKLFSTKRQIKHFAIGPFHPVDIKIERNRENRHQCLNWLDKQENDSVIYVSFGSTTSLTDEQIEELAMGLEKSGVKFIWVLRRADPNDLFSEDDKVARPQLPEGYEERLNDRGIVVRDWAPQLEILAHSSVGGFMSHCGWNSCIESISMGVPIAAWPMHSDQPMNAVLVSQVLRIGVLVRDWAQRGEIVSSSIIESVVETLIVSKEGKEMQKRARELGKEVRRSVDKGGVSRLERDSFIAYISR